MKPLLRVLLFPLVVCEWLSFRIHNYLFPDYKQSLCSRAWWLHTVYPFWAIWVLVFGRKHCESSFKKHWEKK